MIVVATLSYWTVPDRQGSLLAICSAQQSV